MRKAVIGLLLCLACAVSAAGAAAADLSLYMTVSGDPLGTNVIFTLDVFNNSSEDATGVNVIDYLPAGSSFVDVTSSQGSCTPGEVITCNLGILPSGTGAMIEITVQPTTPEPITNEASVGANEDDPYPYNNYASATWYSYAADADLSLTMWAPETVTAGSNLTYDIVVHNTGPGTATGVTLTDTLPAGVTFVSATPAESCSESEGYVTCWLGDLSYYENATVSITVRTESPGEIHNTANVSSSGMDPNYYNNQYTVFTTVTTSSADLSLAMTGPSSPVAFGENLAYSITILNKGPDTATGVNLFDFIPSGASFVSATTDHGSCTPWSIELYCDIGSLTSGSSATVTVVLEPTAPGVITNTAQVSGTEADPDSSNNSASSTVTVVNNTVELNLSMTGPASAPVGSDLSYVLTVTNYGPGPATSVTLTDSPPAGSSVISITPSQGSCSQTPNITCTLGDISYGAAATVSLTIRPTTSGLLTNSASVTSNETDTVSSNNTASVSTNIIASADLGVTMTGSPNPVVVGANLTYGITVSNDGPSTATNVTLSDTLPANVSFVSASANCASSGSLVSCNLGSIINGSNSSVTIIVRPTAPGSITNTATVNGAETDPLSSNNTAFLSTHVSSEVSYTLVADVNGDGRIDVLDYHLIAVPGIYPDTAYRDPLAVFGPGLASCDPRELGIYQYNSETGAYRPYDLGIADVAPGQGYWVITCRNRNLKIVGEPVYPSEPRSVQLPPGWSIVGFPYSIPMSTDHLYVSSMETATEPYPLSDNPWVENQAWAYNKGYIPIIGVGATSGDLHPWNAYWVYNSSLETVNLIINPLLTVGPPVTKKTAATAAAGLSNASAVSGISFSVREKRKNYLDTTLFVGIHPEASTKAQRLSCMSPPPISSEVPRIFVDRRTSKDRPGKYAREFQPLAQSGAVVFPVTLEVPVRKAVRSYILRWNLSNLPPGVKATLIGATRNPINMRKARSCTVVVPKDSKVRKMRVRLSR